MFFLFFHEKRFEDVVCIMAAMLSNVEHFVLVTLCSLKLLIFLPDFSPLDLTVGVSNTSTSSPTTADYVTCGVYDATYITSDPAVLQITCGSIIRGSHVYLQSSASVGRLSLCEVEIYVCEYDTVKAGACVARKTHDNFMKWKHFPCYWPFVKGIHRSHRCIPSQKWQ